jgi:hypothetical protein
MQPTHKPSAKPSSAHDGDGQLGQCLACLAGELVGTGAGLGAAEYANLSGFALISGVDRESPLRPQHGKHGSAESDEIEHRGCGMRVLPLAAQRLPV